MSANGATKKNLWDAIKVKEKQIIQVQSCWNQLKLEISEYHGGVMTTDYLLHRMIELERENGLIK